MQIDLMESIDMAKREEKGEFSDGETMGREEGSS